MVGVEVFGGDSVVSLRSCPFCGLVPDVDNPATFRHETGDRWASVVCCVVGPEIRAGIYTPLEEWKDEAIEAWNERAPNVEVARLQARVAELEAQLAEAQRWVPNVMSYDTGNLSAFQTLIDEANAPGEDEAWAHLQEPCQ